MLYISFIFNIAVCFCLSFIIGIERQYRRRIVGLRTSILVSIGAFLYVSFSFLTGDVNITRVASQVVCGIGFLGAGVIIKDGIKVRGLTTAATLWCDAAIGVLCAGGYVLEALTGTIIIMFSNIVLRNVNKVINEKTDDKNSKYHCKLNIVVKKDKYVKLRDDLDNLLDKDYITKINDNYNIKDNVNVNYEFFCLINKEKTLDKELNNLLENTSYIEFDINKEKEEFEEEIL